MTNTDKKSIIFSLLGHLAIFSVFGVSFGRQALPVVYGRLIFQGSTLNNFDLAHCPGNTKKIFRHTDSIDGPLIRKNTVSFFDKGFFKPGIVFEFNPRKVVFSQVITPAPKAKQAAPVMFYPRLPQYFSLYFKDRQVVHMELMFMLSADNQSKSISIKRKISSGNLEADLLCMRYVNHYLFLQQELLAPGSWQTVKIELSAKHE